MAYKEPDAGDKVLKMQKEPNFYPHTVEAPETDGFDRMFGGPAALPRTYKRENEFKMPGRGNLPDL